MADQVVLPVACIQKPPPRFVVGKNLVLNGELGDVDQVEGLHSMRRGPEFRGHGGRKQFRGAGPAEGLGNEGREQGRAPLEVGAGQCGRGVVGDDDVEVRHGSRGEKPTARQRGRKKTERDKDDGTDAHHGKLAAVRPVKEGRGGDGSGCQ